MLGVVLNVNPSPYVEHPTFCISELLAAFNIVISFYFLVSFDEVLETVTELVHDAVTLNAVLVKNKFGIGNSDFPG